MLNVVTDARARLEQARTEMTENEAGLAGLAETKTEASKAGREPFVRWKEEFEWRSTEKERLTVLIETLEREAADLNGSEADAALCERYKRRREENCRLALRISNELAEINAKATALLRDAAAAALADAEINAVLPTDLEPLVPANLIARGRPGRDREQISAKHVTLWVRSDNHAPIGDPDTVDDLGRGRGVIRRPAPLPAIHCVKMQFEEIAFHPAEAAERPCPLWGLRLLSPDAPRVEFDGVELSHPRAVLAALDRAAQAKESRQRPIETEIRTLVPLESTTIAGIAS